MRILAVFLPIASVAAVALVVWAILGQDGIPSRPASRPAKVVQRRSPVVAQAARAIQGAQAPEPEAVEPNPPVAEKGTGADGPSSQGPLCDRRYDPPKAPKIAMPAGQTMRRSSSRSAEARWTWVNLWAAWCKPCIEEMPLLARWSREGGVRPRPLFLSLDDDERQLRRFLEGKGRALDADITWVHDEGARSAFFGALGVEDPPALPVQALVDPEGRLRCVRVGLVADADLRRAVTAFSF